MPQQRTALQVEGVLFFLVRPYFLSSNLKLQQAGLQLLPLPAVPLPWPSFLRSVQWVGSYDRAAAVAAAGARLRSEYGRHAGRCIGRVGRATLVTGTRDGREWRRSGKSVS